MPLLWSNFDCLDHQWSHHGITTFLSNKSDSDVLAKLLTFYQH